MSARIYRCKHNAVLCTSTRCVVDHYRFNTIAQKNITDTCTRWESWPIPDPSPPQVLRQEHRHMVRRLAKSGPAVTCTLDKEVIEFLVDHDLVYMEVLVDEDDRVAGMFSDA